MKSHAQEVLFLVPFLPANPDISANGTRRRRSEAIEKPASCRFNVIPLAT
jgi:hypothetical protein